MNFEFDGKYLKPNKAIVITEQAFEDCFVNSLSDTAHRIELYSQYKAFIKAFSEQITPNFEVWIGGSFTTKKEFPNDIDLVIFADYKVFEAKQKEFDVLKMNYQGSQKRLDIYKVDVYPENHRQFSWYESDKIEWLHLFTKTRRRKLRGKATSRGFIKIIYHE